MSTDQAKTIDWDEALKQVLFVEYCKFVTNENIILYFSPLIWVLILLGWR